MEQQKDPSEVGELGPEGRSQWAFQLAQLALQLRGDSKEPPETFLDDALSLLNAARDRIEPKRNPRDAAYDEFQRTGKKEDLATWLYVSEEQIPTESLFFSGSKKKKPEIASFKQVGLAADGVVIWSPKDRPNYSPEFGKWEPMAWDHFFSLSKGLLKRCYDKQLKELEERPQALQEQLKELDAFRDEKFNDLRRQISSYFKEEAATGLKQNARTEVATSQPELQDLDAVWRALTNHELSRDKALTIVREIFDKEQKKVHEQFDDHQQRVREQIDKLRTIDLKEYRSQLQRKIKVESIWDSLFLFLFSVRYPDNYAEYAKLQLTPIENDCKETREKPKAKKRKLLPRDEYGKFTKPKT